MEKQPSSQETLVYVDSVGNQLFFSKLRGRACEKPILPFKKNFLISGVVRFFYRRLLFYGKGAFYVFIFRESHAWT